MSSQELDVAVLGVTGEVGRVLLEVLEQRKFPVRQLYPLASARSAGETLEFRGKPYVVLDAEEFDFAQVPLALFSAGGSVSERYVPLALDAGTTVIDNTSHFRMHEGVPLIVPEVNAIELDGRELPLVAPCPNCSTIQLAVALWPLAQVAELRRLDVVTFQAVSGAGRSAVAELASQTHRMLVGEQAEPEIFDRSIAFNVLPRIGAFDEQGDTTEEIKMIDEMRKIFGQPELIVNPTCVRVPVFYGHSEAVRAEFAQPITPEQAREILVKAPGVEVMDDVSSQIYPTPLDNGAGLDGVVVGRIRQADARCDDNPGNALNLWVVADNVRKGAAVNSVQIAEHLLPRLR